MLALRIDQVDMLLRDQRALEILRSRFNPKTGRAEITVSELADELHCGRRTAGRILTRLEGAGHIVRHNESIHQRPDIEVFPAND